MKNVTRWAMLASALAMSGMIILPSPAEAEASASQHVMFILDGSNSMWGQIDGTAKIQIAKQVLKSQISGLPTSTKAGLIAYGHRFAKELNNCDDIELVSGYGLDSSKSIDDMLAYVVPRGQTPIAKTLEESIAWVKGPDADQPVSNPTVVLITDGVESCDGDPCQAARNLAGAGINTTIHVVGFGLNEQERGQVQCIAENGHGKYFAAADAAGLNDALNQVEFEMAQAAPEPAVQAAPVQASQPVRTSFFEDDFDGTDLSDAWQVAGANPDAFIVEDGQLMMVSSKVNLFDTDPAENIVTLAGDLPSGDWDMIADVKGELKTGADGIQFGLYKDNANFLTAYLWNQGTGTGDDCGRLVLRLSKVAGGEATQFDASIAGTEKCGYGIGNHAEALRSFAEDGARITFSKRGRDYSASIVLPGVLVDGAPVEAATETLTSLRVPGKPSLIVGKYRQADGEILTFFDKVEIVSVEQ